MLWAKRGWASPGSQFLRAAEQLGATDAWDFVDNSYMRAGVVTTNAGLTVTRASTGYAETSDGRLVSFASGVLRRTDKGVLVEDARTNLLLRSQEFNDAYWSKTNTTVTANAATAPDGTSTADTLTETATTAEHVLLKNPVLSTGARNKTYTLSVYLKPNGRTQVLLGAFNATGNQSKFLIDLLAFTATVDGNGSGYGNFSGTATNSGNGWCRATITFTSNDTANGEYLGIAIWPNSTTSYAGDGTSGVHIWGAQLEAASFASSYIPTTGSTATRAADVVTLTAPAALVSGYTVFAQWDGSQNANGRVIDFGNSTLIRRSGGTNLNFNGAGLEGSAVGAFASGKAAIAIDAAAVRGAANGSSVTVTTGSYSSSSQTALRFGSTGTSNYLDGYIRRIAIFPSALSDAQLQAITT
jgi:hypothetical protein